MSLSFLKKAGEYLTRNTKKPDPVLDSETLGTFIETRSSLVAQSSLYGYIKTRAGTRFPELFENEEFLTSINIAKWQIWAACVSDLAVFAGGLIFLKASDAARIRRILQSAVQPVLERTGLPEEAGSDFARSVEQVTVRLDSADFSQAAEHESAFTRSPDALIYWAPIVDELKALDDEIVRNSIRFRWQEPRRELRALLEVDALLKSTN